MCFMLLPKIRVQSSKGSDCLTPLTSAPLWQNSSPPHCRGLKTQLWPTYSAWHSFSASHVTLSPLIYVSPLKGQLSFLLKQCCMSFLSLLPAADSGHLSPWERRGAMQGLTTGLNIKLIYDSKEFPPQNISKLYSEFLHFQYFTSHFCPTTERHNPAQWSNKAPSTQLAPKEMAVLWAKEVPQI